MGQADAQEEAKRLAVLQSGNGSGRSWQPVSETAVAAAAAAGATAAAPSGDR